MYFNYDVLWMDSVLLRICTSKKLFNEPQYRQPKRKNNIQKQSYSSISEGKKKPIHQKVNIAECFLFSSLDFSWGIGSSGMADWLKPFPIRVRSECAFDTNAINQNKQIWIVSGGLKTRDKAAEWQTDKKKYNETHLVLCV